MLSYELEVRKEVVELMIKGTAINIALPAAYKDALVKERFFTTSLALGTTFSRPTNNNKDEKRGEKRSTFMADRKGKGKGKGRKGRGGKRQREENRCSPHNPGWEEDLLWFQRKGQTVR